jgi:hypothetical protein
MNRKINFTGFVIYKNLNNKYFNNFVRKVRAKFKTTLINSKIATDEIKKNKIKGIKGVFGFASNRSPENKIKKFCTIFLGLEVPFSTFDKNYRVTKLQLEILNDLHHPIKIESQKEADFNTLNREFRVEKTERKTTKKLFLNKLKFWRKNNGFQK